MLIGDATGYLPVKLRHIKRNRRTRPRRLITIGNNFTEFRPPARAQIQLFIVRLEFRCRLRFRTAAPGVYLSFIVTVLNLIVSRGPQ